MNYRHAFHAGNHADVFKHTALTILLEHLLQKPQPFAVLDTHAGAGVYDLAGEPAQKTREHEAGAGRILGRGLASAPRYAELLEAMNPAGLKVYPGSPEIVRRMLREGDRLIACELHPDDAKALKAWRGRDPRIAVHHRDGYEAIGALLPPAERRGLVLIDPPFEAPDDASRLAEAIGVGLRKWPTGVFLAWYPIKDSRIGDLIWGAAIMGRFPRALRAECSPYRRDGVAMAGSGLLVCNAPWKLDENLSVLCAELSARLGEGEGSWSVRVLDAPPP